MTTVPAPVKVEEVMAGLEGLDITIMEIEGVNCWVFNSDGIGATITLREFEAGRVAHGLRRAQQGDVNRAELSILAEMDPTIQYVYNRRTHETQERLLTPTLNGMKWRSTGREDPGYMTELSGRKFPHQVTSSMAAFLVAINDNVIVVPVSERYEAEVKRQAELARMEPAARMEALKAFKDERKAVQIQY